MHEHRFQGGAARLRSPERLAWLEVNRVVDLSMQNAYLRRVLDVGTGSGIFAEAFAKAGLEVEGVDANPEMLAEARRLVPNVPFQEGTAESLPYPVAAFDLVFMGMLLHETDDHLKAMQEAARVTRNKIAILEWPYRAQDIGPGLDERLRAEQVKGMANQVGFENVEIISLNMLVLFIISK